MKLLNVLVSKPDRKIQNKVTIDTFLWKVAVYKPAKLTKILHCRTCCLVTFTVFGKYSNV